MRREIGFAIVSMTSISIGTSSVRDFLMDSQLSTRVIMSNAVMRCIRSKIDGVASGYRDSSDWRREGLNVPRVSIYTARTSGVALNRESIMFESNCCQNDYLVGRTTVLQVFVGPANSVMDPRRSPPLKISSSLVNPVDIL